MGSLLGHVVPGTFFILFSLWWSYSMFLRYFMSKKFVSRGRGYKSTPTFPCSCCPRFPLEAILKIVAVTIGITGEAWTGIENGHFAHLGNAQHITMFFFFGFSGLMDLLYFYKYQLPSNLDYVAAIMAFAVEGFLFYHHLHGRTPMDIQVHMFLFDVVVCCVICCSLEMCYKHNVVPALGRAFFTCLQGTWFYQVGFILYPPGGPRWDEENHSQMMVVTLIFTWHIAGLFVFYLLFGWAVWFKVKCMTSGGSSGGSAMLASYQRLDMEALPNDRNHATSLLMNKRHSANHAVNATDIQAVLDSESEDI